MIVSSKKILYKAASERYAIAACNASNMEIIQAIVAAAEEENTPIILQFTQSTIKYAGLSYISSLAHAAAQKASIPVILHLDHGTNYNTIINCIKNGWNSIMVDGSNLTLSENIAFTSEIVKVAHACNVSVEAEVGRILYTKEAKLIQHKKSTYTDPNEALLFVKQTKVDFLAVSVGNAHGKDVNYKTEIDFNRLKLIKNLIKIPLVLHGASGLYPSQLKQAIKLGISKINIDTDIQEAFSNGCKEILSKNQSEQDPRKICGKARENVKKIILEKIKILGCSGKS